MKGGENSGLYNDPNYCNGPGPHDTVEYHKTPKYFFHVYYHFGFSKTFRLVESVTFILQLGFLINLRRTTSPVTNGCPLNPRSLALFPDKTLQNVTDCLNPSLL